MTITCERPPDGLDLDAYVGERREALKTSVENLAVINEISNKRGAWTYVVSIVEWGPDESRIRQKQTYVYVPGESPKLFTLTGTDLADNFKQSEAIFNQAIKSFTPNDIQAF